MNTESLISLVYVSSAVGLLTDDDVLSILRTARRKNELLGITGMLLYKDGNFMQVLEGPSAQIQQLTGAIKQDPRHRGLIQLIEQPIAERQFPNWSMGFQNLNALATEDQAAFTPYLTHSLLDEEFRANPAKSYKLLSRFKESIR